MLYGYKEMVDNRISTVVAAADSIREYDSWIESLPQHTVSNYEELYLSKGLDHLLRDEFKGYHNPVLVVYHESEEQRSEFIDQWQIKEMQDQMVRSFHTKMISRNNDALRREAEAEEDAQAEAEGREITGRTIEEVFDLVDNDPWDRRSEAQIERDNRQKALSKEMQKIHKKGQSEVTGDSFSPSEKQQTEDSKPGNTTGNRPVISDIGVKDGSIERVLAHKQSSGDPTSPANELKPEQKTPFTLEDFAEVLRGDGSSDVIDMPPDEDADKRTRRPGRDAVLSPAAEEARRQYQEQLAEKEKERAAKARVETDIVAKENRKQNIFKGCNLLGNETIEVSALPEVIREFLQRVKVEKLSVPYKIFPYDSFIGDRIVVPSSHDVNHRVPYLAHIENLELEGELDIGLHRTFVLKHTDKSKDGWIIYSWYKENEVKGKGKNKVTEKKAEQFAAVVHVRGE